jgi:hypothetical protein
MAKGLVLQLILKLRNYERSTQGLSRKVNMKH